MKSVIERFDSKIEKTKDCWNWIGAIKKDGYGQFSLSSEKSFLAHRFSWILNNGDIPKTLCILHKCDNKKCVNPKHLFIGTNQDNSNDMCKKGRQSRGENALAKLTIEQVRSIRKEYIPRKVSCYFLASKYGVVPKTIHNIITKTRWKHIL